MRSTIIKASQLALALLLGGALIAGDAWAAGRQFDMSGDGTSSMGATNTASGEVRGRSIGKGTYSAAIDVGGNVFTAPSGAPCNEGSGVVTYTKSNGDTLVMDTTGLVCEVGLSGAGSVLVPNEVYSGAVAVDGATSTGVRFNGAAGTGTVQVNFAGDGSAVLAGHGALVK